MRRIAITAAALLLVSGPSVGDETAFHFIKVVEVFPGSVAHPSAQFIELQMYAAGQTFVSGRKVFIFDAAGAKIDSITFGGNVPNGLNQARILIGTSQAATLFSPVTMNFSMNPTIP